MLYFAYGSNMQWERIRDRCPSAEFMCKAMLPGYRLTFPRYSRNNESWTASIERADGHAVWGVVYAISDKDIRLLDRQEGYRPDRPTNMNAHIPLQCYVFDGGAQDKALAVMTYITNAGGKPPPARRDRKAPSKEYKSRLVEGAKHWNLPEAY